MNIATEEKCRLLRRWFAMTRDALQWHRAIRQIRDNVKGVLMSSGATISIDGQPVPFNPYYPPDVPLGPYRPRLDGAVSWELWQHVYRVREAHIDVCRLVAVHRGMCEYLDEFGQPHCCRANKLYLVMEDACEAFAEQYRAGHCKTPEWLQDITIARVHESAAKFDNQLRARQSAASRE